MKRLLVLIAVLSFALVSTAQAAVVDRIAAVVNNDIITTYALDQAVATRDAGKAEQATSAKQRDALRRQVLNQLILEDLLQQKIKELGIRVSDKELDAAIQDVEKQNHLTHSQLIAALKAQGMSVATYRENLRKQILRIKLVGREVRSKVQVTHQELFTYYQQHIADYRQEATVRISDISFPLPAHASPKEVAATREKAQKALAKIRQGEDFSAVLKAYSASGAAQGGDLGIFNQSQLTAVFSKAIAGLPKGGVSPVVETPRGFLILKVVDLTPGQPRTFDTVKGEIQRTLMTKKTRERYKKWTSELKKKAYIVIRL